MHNKRILVLQDIKIMANQLLIYVDYSNDTSLVYITMPSSAIIIRGE
jgi:hypothetical protein